MARFRFRLQRLLEHRLRLEQEKQRVVAQLESSRVALENKLREQQRQIEEAKRDLRDALHPVGTGSAEPTGMVDLRAARLQAGASMRCLQQSQLLVLQLAGVHSRLETARGALMEATSARKAVELLRDRAHERWKKDQDRRETSELDDIGASRWNQARRENAGALG
ncbi:MAG: flagellar export protein FliJ [Planctomycetota bacterium]